MYGQKNYLATQGINGRYRIDQIGCFITAFCNLLERYGVGVDPIGINNYFVSHGTYVDVDDGVRDDVGWGTVSAFDNNIVVTRTGAGWPSTDNAIVKFHYQSISNPRLANGQPNMIDHFCLVASAANRTIVDSWDGQVKSPGAYGQPIAFAEYTHVTPQPVTPPIPQPTCTYEDVAEHLMITNKQPTSWWNLNGETFGDLKPAAQLNASTAFLVGGYAHHRGISQYTYAMTPEDYARVKRGDYGANNGVNILDLDPMPEPPATTAPVVPEKPVETPPAVEETPSVPAAPAIDISWQKTTKNVADYKATEDYVVMDISTGGEFANLYKGQIVHAAERFTKDGIDYVRTQKSVDNNRWVGIPITVLQLVKDIDIAPQDDDAIFKTLEIGEIASKIDDGLKSVNTAGFRQSVVKFVGQVMLFFTKKKNKRKIL